jgi:hypothetical protein
MEQAVAGPMVFSSAVEGSGIPNAIPSSGDNGQAIAPEKAGLSKQLGHRSS